MSAVDDAVGRAAEVARRRFAAWQGDVFAGLALPRAELLADAPAGDVERAMVLDAYLRLLAEGVGQGYVGPAPESSEAEPAGLLQRLLLDVLPPRLARLSAQHALSLLARAWNIGEGVERSPRWMSRMASALIADPIDADRLEEQVATALAPLLDQPARRARFAGPFVVRVLDLRPTLDAFLPGAMHVATPALVCVHDRRRAGVHLPVVLLPGDPPRALAPAPCPGIADGAGAGAPRPALAFAPERLTIERSMVELPTVADLHSIVALEAGFVVVAALDSQRLWIAEAAA